MNKTIYDPRYRALIKDMSTRRQNMRMSQAQVCKSMGACSTWLSKIEQFELRLDVLCFVRLCRVYGIKAGKAISTLETEESSEDDSFLAIGGRNWASWQFQLCSIWWFSYARLDVLLVERQTR